MPDHNHIIATGDQSEQVDVRNNQEETSAPKRTKALSELPAYRTD